MSDIQNLTIKTIENEEIVLTPLDGRITGDFCATVEKLERPYIAISKDEYDKIYSVGNDYFKYENQVVTFGNADRGYALMPLQYKYAKKILDRNLVKLS